MQKIPLIFMLLLYSLVGQSQDTKATLTIINNYAENIEKLLVDIGSSLKTGRYSVMEHQAGIIKGNLELIETQFDSLPDEYYNNISSIVNSYKTDVNEFQVLALKNAFPDKYRLLNTAYSGLQNRNSEFRKVLETAYDNALQEQDTVAELQPDNENDKEEPVNEIVQEDTVQTVESPAANDETAIILDETSGNGQETKTYNITSADNLVLLGTIYKTQDQIQKWIDSVHLAMNKNNFTNVGIYAKNISNASLKISDLALLLKSDQKESLFILAIGVRNLAETLHELSHKGMSSHHDMHETIDQLEIKFSSFSTGISLIQ